MSSFYFLRIVDSKRSMVSRSMVGRTVLRTRIITYYYYLEKDRIR